ncbi:MAG: hypothetical protein O2820_18710 [Planctomycetota bacterium]|nr:hypothetical protein [Planctomycetota bacterium]MDA1251245.1 hypothetical protein [Planctomycetota bacterium]
MTAVALAELMRAVGERPAQGDLDGVLKLVWPMISNVADLPAADAVLKPQKINTGWVLNDDSPSALRKSIAHAFANVGRAEFVRDGARASLLGYWLAAQLSRDDEACPETTKR